MENTRDPNTKEGFDIIGDIHGCATHLCRLLESLGYKNHGTDLAPRYFHKNRKVIFLGDYIDRGSEIFKTLAIVRSMVDSGSAYAIMGNHEYNAILYDTPDGNGEFLRTHNDSHTKQHQETLEQCERVRANWDDWIQWFKTLPLWLQIKDSTGREIHAVHACFDTKKMKELFSLKVNESPLLVGEFSSPRMTERAIFETAKKGSASYKLLEDILKGPESRIQGEFKDNDGNTRHSIRLRWWEKKATLKEMALMDLTGFTEESLKALEKPFDGTDYRPVDVQVPTFFGHYWLTPEQMKPLTSFVACLDSSCVKKKQLTAYRYNAGDEKISGERFVSFKA